MYIDITKLADTQVVADKLGGLPKEALLYIAGYAEGFRDRAKDNKADETKPPTKQTRPPKRLAQAGGRV